MEVEGELVVQACVEVGVVLMAVGAFIPTAGSDENEVGRLDVIEEAHGLACVDDHHDFFVHLLEVHLVVYLAEVVGLEHFRVLNFEEVIAAMTIEVNEYFRL